MAIIKWRDSYNTGIEKVDQEHKKIVDLIEQMHCVIRDKGGLEDVTKVLDAVVEYTQNHFVSEEELMQELEYDGYVEHKAEHEKLIEDVGIFKEKITSSPEGVQEFYRFLREWLVDHIMDSDKKFGEFVTAKQG